MTRPLLLATLALLALAPAATASTAQLSGGTLTITGGPERNDIMFGGNSALQEYVVDLAGIAAGGSCLQVEPTKVDCKDYTALVADLGGGDDQLLAGLVSGVPVTVTGGDGADTIYGSGETDAIDGGPGDDVLDGNGGHDDVQGGTGNDTIYAGGDATITGGPGRDSLFGGSRNPLNVGNSTVQAVDGEIDQISCGVFGTSIVYADTDDVVDPLCTSVHRVGATLAIALGDAPTGSTIRRLLKRGYHFTCTLSAPGTLRVDLRIRRTGKRIASASGPADAGTYEVTLSVARRLRRAVKRAGTLRTTLVVSVVGAGGATATKKLGVTFR